MAPLAGVKVVEFCQVAAGPFSAMLLADFGAEVIKVEPPDGDVMRSWPPLSAGPDGTVYSENFASLNRSKQSVFLDLKKADDLEQARALILQADVLIENNRPGAMQRLGLGWDWCQQAKPTLVYCSISAFGQDGPRAQQGGFDVTVQAASGVMSVTGESGGGPVKAGVPVSDFVSGLYAAFSIASVLRQVQATGQGAHIDVPMFATSLALSALQTSEYFGTGRDPVKMGSAHPRNAPYQAYQANDGWLVIAAGNNKLWQAVCAAMNQMHLLEQPDFTSPALRAKNQLQLKALLDPVFIKQPVAHWIAVFEQAQVPCSRINSYSQALQDPQSQHLGLVLPQGLPNGHQTHTVGCPVRLNGQPLVINTQPAGAIKP
jgi:crotonobetainyl-CoA:carnitine CoA-transferase CaiB-like acyl-CoA transferase